MTQRLFHNATLVDPEQETCYLGALLVHDGVISQVYDTPNPEGVGADDYYDCEGHCLAPGIVDLGVVVCEPGGRHKESFRTAGRAAALGGVTTMVTRPSGDAAIDTPEELEFLVRRAADVSLVRVYPMAALTKGQCGAEMTEIAFLKKAGAIAFTDCENVTRDTKVLSRALTYAKSHNALVIGHPQEPILSHGAVATSGKFATLLGLPSVSVMAEKMGLERDLSLVDMTSADYHVDQITTRVALESLKRAKARGLPVSAGIGVHHLALNEFDIADYRTFFKLIPPLRSEDDRLAMIQAVADGDIDIIGSFHTPQDEESKRLPFEEAASGAIGLETLLPAALRLYHDESLSLNQLFKALSLNPSKRLGLETGRLCTGAPADIVVFDPDAPFRLQRETLQSKSKNTPFDGELMQGQVTSTWVAGRRVDGDLRSC